jgi:acetylornithine deacetylase/succinyl-diaminopimelate desuccinylase-like protein
MKRYLFLIVLYLPVLLPAQPIANIARHYAEKHFETLKELLAIPNDAHFPADIEENVQWCEIAFRSHGFHLKRLETATVPLLLATRECQNPDARTVLIYLQVDGQPVDPVHWYQEDPYEATLKRRAEEGGWETLDWDLIHDRYDPEWRIFARSTSDSKGAVVMFLASLDALQDLQREPNFHMKVIMDFEEEIGSPRLPGAVSTYREDLAADMLIIFDGPRHITNRPTLTFGARGISTITLTVYGPYLPQHSGHYGNFAPNPAIRLSQLIGSMKDDSGRVVIPGFYEGITIDEETREILRQVPDDEKYIMANIGIAEADKVAPTYQESLQYPSLNVRGMASGWVGEERRTIIPATATAEIDIRLVSESDPDRLIALVRKHIADRGYHMVSDRPTQRERLTYSRICRFESNTSYLAFRTDFDSDVGLWLHRSLKKAFSEEPIRQRTSGGSIPISPFVTTLGIPAVTVPTVNRDNNQHSPNENLRIGNFIDGVRTMLAILMEPL